MPVWQEKVKRELIRAGFINKKNVFFRIRGDGILQIIKMDKTSRDTDPELMIGLQSMYSELLEQWLTPAHCIPRYSIMLFSGGQSIHRTIPIIDDEVRFIDVEKSEQCEILLTAALPRLDNVESQRDLLDILFEIESISGCIVWNDIQKYAPFMCVNDYVNACKVITSILDQHEFAEKTKRQFFSSIGKPYIIPHFALEENAKLNTLLNLARQKDPEAIQNYLIKNYKKNITLLQKHIPEIGGRFPISLTTSE